jgi:hypothetical protein
MHNPRPCMINSDIARLSIASTMKKTLWNSSNTYFNQTPSKSPTLYSTAPPVFHILPPPICFSQLIHIYLSYSGAINLPHFHRTTRRTAPFCDFYCPRGSYSLGSFLRPPTCPRLYPDPSRYRKTPLLPT